MFDSGHDPNCCGRGLRWRTNLDRSTLYVHTTCVKEGRVLSLAGLSFTMELQGIHKGPARLPDLTESGDSRLQTRGLSTRNTVRGLGTGQNFCEIGQFQLKTKPNSLRPRNCVTVSDLEVVLGAGCGEQ